MALFEYCLPAVRGLQAGREYFVTMCPLALVPRLFQLEDTELRPALRAQRVLNKGRIPDIARYISGHPKSYVLSALAASIDGQVQFQPLAQSKSPAVSGLLNVSMSARLLIHDGLHRCAAIEAALKARPELGQETITLILYPDPGFRRAEQLFSDMKRNEARSARSQGILYDRRDETARLVRELAAKVPVFSGTTEMVRSKISNRALKLFTLSAIYHATRSLLADHQEEPFSKNLELATAFWSEVATHIPEWQQAKAGQISPAELRKNYVHAHAIALAALGRAGRTLLQKYPDSWRERLRKLRSIDWSRDNQTVWEGRAMVAGRLSKASSCVLLTGNLIKQRLGLPLSPDETKAEQKRRRET
jgi:DNA sulfur modification protein DndB